MKTLYFILFILLGFAGSAQTPKAYITNYGDDFISVIDIQKNKKIADIKTGSKPHGSAVSPDGKWIAVSNGKFIYLTIRWFHGLIKIDVAQNKIVTWVQLPLTSKFDSEGKAAHGLCVSPDGKTVYLTSQFTDDVISIDVASDKILKTIKVGKNPNWIELTPDGKSAIASNTSSNDASIIDIEKWQITATIPVGKNPKRLWVANTK